MQVYFQIFQTGGVGENRGGVLPFFLPLPLLPYPIPPRPIALISYPSPSHPFPFFTLPFFLPSLFPSPVNGGQGV
jgi:hypothetical protein